jgi:carboxymethylenebutenolidase
VAVAAGSPPLVAPAPESVSFPSEDGATMLVGYLFKPAHSCPCPAVVMMHGRGGAFSTRTSDVYDGGALSGRHREWATFWADRGYIGLHVDSFGPRGYPHGFAAGTYQARPPGLSELTIRPLDAYGAVRFLRSRPEVIPDRIGLHGWSNGGTAALAAMAGDAPGIRDPTPATGFRAAVAFYPACGLGGRYAAGYRPYAPVLVLVATHDEEVSPQRCEKFVAAGKAAGGAIEIVSYAGAQHAFDDPGPGKRGREANRLATIDARNRVAEFFERHLQRFGAAMGEPP